MKRTQDLLAILLINCVLGIGAVCLAQQNAPANPSVDAREKKEAAKQNEFRWQGRIAPGLAIEIQGIKGNVRAAPAAGDQVEVLAVKGGRDNPNEVTIQVLNHDQGVTLCAVYPSQDPSRPYRCQPSKAGQMAEVATNIEGGRAEIKFSHGGGGEVRLLDVRVDFLVRVPRGVRFIGFTVDGEVEAKSLAGDVAAQSVLGDVSVELPAKTGARVRAETLTGGIKSDFPLSVQTRSLLKRSANGTVGDGTNMLTLKTVTGNIRLRPAR